MFHLGEFPEAVLAFKVMVPFHLGVVAEIARHPHGKAALVLFHYLQAVTAMNRTRNGWASVSQEALRGVPGLDTSSRRRGLKALEELGLVELKREGRTAYHAKLLYQCPSEGQLARPRTKAASAAHKAQAEALPLTTPHSLRTNLRALAARE